MKKKKVTRTKSVSEASATPVKSKVKWKSVNLKDLHLAFKRELDPYGIRYESLKIGVTCLMKSQGNGSVSLWDANDGNILGFVDYKIRKVKR